MVVTNAVFKGTAIGRFYYNVLLLSASDPMDYTNTSGLLLMLPVFSEVCVEVPIEDDDLVETPENFFVTFIPNVPGVLSSISTVTILDNDQIGKQINYS